MLLGYVESASEKGHLGVFVKLGGLFNGQAIDVTLADGVVTHYVTIFNLLYSRRCRVRPVRALDIATGHSRRSVRQRYKRDQYLVRHARTSFDRRGLLR